MTVITNYHWREPVWESVDWDESGSQHEGVRYRGEFIPFEDFMRFDYPPGAHVPDWSTGWDGYRGDSFFSAVVVRFAPDSDWISV